MSTASCGIMANDERNALSPTRPTSVPSTRRSHRTVDEAEERHQHRRLARAGPTDDAELFAARDTQLESRESERQPVRVAQAHVAELDRARRRPVRREELLVVRRTARSLAGHAAAGKILEYPLHSWQKPEHDGLCGRDGTTR